MTAPEVSIVIPCHNEEQNLRPLFSAIHAAMDPLGLNFEVVITDDCSADNSWGVSGTCRFQQLTLGRLRRIN